VTSGQQPPDPQVRARQLAAEATSGGEPLGWFEQLYREVAAGRGSAPWDREVPNPLLVEWLANHPIEPDGKQALVIGSGLGNDAELIAARGFATTAFDIAPSAVDLAHRRYPDSSVDYRVADLFDPPADWRHRFDLVVECLTVPALPPRLHGPAAESAASFCAVGGLMIVIGFAATEDQPVDGPPWPLTTEDLGHFATGGVERAVIESVPGPTGGMWWRAEFRRPDPERDEDRTGAHWL
jgi:hypothetical protein